MKRSRLSLTSVLILVTLQILAFQNCAPMTASSANQQEQDKSASGPAPVATPTPSGSGTKPTPTPKPTATPTSTPAPADGIRLKTANNICVNASASVANAETCKNTDSEVFTATQNTDGSIQLENAVSGLCLELSGATDGAAIAPKACSTSAAQRFSLLYQGATLRSLVSQLNGSCVSIDQTTVVGERCVPASSTQTFVLDSTFTQSLEPADNTETVLAEQSGPALATKLRGVHLGGAESGNLTTQDKFGTNYAYPTKTLMDTFAKRGFNLFRVSIKSGRLQPVRSGPLDAAELAHLTAVITYARSLGIYVLIDPHDYAQLPDATLTNQIIGTTAMPAIHFADFWKRMAKVYSKQDNVIFGLMNEPHGLAATAWQSAAVGVVSAIRSVGAENLITVPGVSYTSASDWVKSGSGATWALFHDSNFVFEVHRYLDNGSSGTQTTCQVGAGSAGFGVFISWAETYGQKGFLGEFGWAANAGCETEGTAAMKLLESSPAMVGWSYFGAGWYNGFMTLNPDKTTGADKPQLQVLSPWLK